MKEKIKKSFLDLLFPKFCFSCRKEGEYLCQDCRALLEISGFHQNFQTETLADLYFALDYQNPLLKNLIQKFKCPPFIKELTETLSSLIINHFQLLDNPPPFLGGGSEFLIIPVPLENRKLKWRGFNQAEEIGKEISKFLNIPTLNNVLIKTKGTPPQVELTPGERNYNVRGVFSCQNPEEIKGRKILLVDDIFTTGSTMTECGRVLKEAGARKITGIVIARASPEEDRLNV